MRMMRRSFQEDRDTSASRRREDRRGDALIDRALPNLVSTLSVKLVDEGKDYLSETPGGHRRLMDDAVNRLGTLIQHRFVFGELAAGELGEYDGRGLVEVGFGNGPRLTLEYVRSELECFTAGSSFRSRNDGPVPALHFEFYYDREQDTWRDEEGGLLESSSRIWREDPGRNPDRSFP